MLYYLFHHLSPLLRWQTIFQRHHIRAFLLFVEIICAAIENVTIFRILLYNQIAIYTFGAFQDVVHVHSVVGHKVAQLYLIGTNPQVQSIVFIKLIFQWESADGTAQIKQVNHLHIEVFIMRDIEILDEFYKEPGGLCFGAAAPMYDLPAMLHSLKYGS